MFHYFTEKTQYSVGCPIAATRYSGTVAPLSSMQQAAHCSMEAAPWRTLAIRPVWANFGRFETVSNRSRSAPWDRRPGQVMGHQEHGGRSDSLRLRPDDRLAVPSARGRGVLDQDQGSIPGVRSNGTSRLNGPAVLHAPRSTDRAECTSTHDLGSRPPCDPTLASTPEWAASRLPSRRTAPWNRCPSTRSPLSTDRAESPRQCEQMTTHPLGFLVARAGCPRSRHAWLGSPAGMPGNHLLRSANSDAERPNGRFCGPVSLRRHGRNTAWTIVATSMTSKRGTDRKGIQRGTPRPQLTTSRLTTLLAHAVDRSCPVERPFFIPSVSGVGKDWPTTALLKRCAAPERT